MATKTGTQTRGPRRAILPYVPRRNSVQPDADKTQALWPWYLVPFQEPDVSLECRAFVLGEYEPESDEERRILLSELAEANTVRSDAASAIVQAPGGASAVRGDYYAKGFRAISPVTGEASGGPPLMIFEPQMESGHQIGRTLVDPYIGIKDILEDLSVRQKWHLAQLDAKIEVFMELSTESSGEAKRYLRGAVAAHRRRRQGVANGLPTAKELQLHFKRYELQKLESRQDQRLKEQQALQGRIDDQNAQISRLSSEINAEWPAEVPA